MTGSLNGGVRFDLSFMYPDLWKFYKNEKFNPIHWQPDPKVCMTFNSLIFIYKIVAGQFVMSHGSYNLNLGSGILILGGDIRSRSWLKLFGRSK